MYLVPFDNHLWLFLQWSHIKKQNWSDAPERFHQSRTDSHLGIHTITSPATHLRSVSFEWYAVCFILLSFHIFSGFTFILKKKRKKKGREKKMKPPACGDHHDIYLTSLFTSILYPHDLIKIKIYIYISDCLTYLAIATRKKNQKCLKGNLSFKKEKNYNLPKATFQLPCYVWWTVCPSPGPRAGAGTKALCPATFTVA